MICAAVYQRAPGLLFFKDTINQYRGGILLRTILFNTTAATTTKEYFIQLYEWQLSETYATDTATYHHNNGHDDGHKDEEEVDVEVILDRYGEVSC